MSELPKIPSDVIGNIQDWVVHGSYQIEKIRSDKKAIKEIQEFYASLNIPVKSNKLYHRGLMVSRKGFIKLLENRKVDLKQQVIESWTCDREIAYGFAMPISDAIGVVVTKNIPKNKLIADLNALYDLYKMEYLRTGTSGSVTHTTLRMLDEIEGYMNECEVLAETMCVKCDMDEISGISFTVKNVSNSDITLIAEFIDDLDSKNNFVGKLIDNLINWTNDMEKKPYIVLNKKKGRWEVGTGNTYNRALRELHMILR